MRKLIYICFFFSKQEIDKTLPIWQTILTVLSEQDRLVQDNFIIGKTLYQRTVSHLQLHILLNISSNSFEDITAYLVTQLSHESHDIKEFTLNFMLCCLSTPNSKLILHNLEIPDEEKILTNSIVPRFKTTLLHFLRENPIKFNEKLMEIIKCDERLCSKALFIVSHCAQAALEVGRQDGGCDAFSYFKDTVYSTHDDDVVVGVLCCIRTCLNNIQAEDSFDQTDVEEVFDILPEFSSLNNAVSCRYIISMIIVDNAQLLLGEKRIKYGKCFVIVLQQYL